MEKIIKRVFISNLWKYKNVDCSFNEDINILIGKNGTSKTTFLTIVESVLNVELFPIIDVEFDHVLVEIVVKGTIHIIKVERFSYNDVVPVFRYQFDNEECIDISLSEMRNNMAHRLSINSRNSYNLVKRKLSDLLQISWLSITRVDEKERDYRNYSEVDIKLDQLMNQIVSYKLQLETQLNERSKKFNADLVSLLLYNELYDSFPTPEDFDNYQQVDLDDMRTKLHHVFSFFGNVDKYSEAIKCHVNKFKKFVDYPYEIEHTDEKILLLYSLFNRTRFMLSLSTDFQKDKRSINEPITTYTDILGQFIKDKTIEFNENGEMLVFLKETNFNDNKRQIVINTLSSGEKQLLILLTETLLQQKKPFIFIADEPELSLHIEWQRNLISSIRAINPNAQIILATHAPEIAAKHVTKLINMESITSYVKSAE